MVRAAAKPTWIFLIWLCALTLGLARFENSAFATEGFSGFRYLAEPESAEADSELWKPVPTEKISIVNLAPLLLPYVNNSPVFGVPGTVLGNFWERTQVSGDWGGVRTDLARRGLFLDIYTTTTYQNVTSGGVDSRDAFFNNLQMSLNIDTGRAGLWSGGLLHFTMQARHGSSPDKTFTVGTYTPHHYGLLLPGPELSHHIYPSDFYIVQALGKNFAVIAGKISGLFLPDQTLFADYYRYAFTNFNFNKNPFFANFYGPTAWAGLGVWAPAPWLVIEGGVLDPNTKADNFATDAFKHVNLYGQVMFNYAVGHLPGQVSFAGNWTSKPKVDLKSPIELSFGLGNSGEAQIGVSINRKGESWFSIANFSQYLYVIDDPNSIRDKLKSGQQLRGVGVFGRFGYSPEQTNPVARHASGAFYARGLLDVRARDSIGVGFYWNGISDNLKNSVGQISSVAGSPIDIKDETGVEVFYDFAITPAVRLIPSYQHIRNPLLAQVETRKKHADVFLMRLSVAW